MQNAKLRKRLFAMLAVAALTALFVLAGCGDDDDDARADGLQGYGDQ